MKLKFLCPLIQYFHRYGFVIYFPDGIPGPIGLPGPVGPKGADVTSFGSYGAVYVRWGRTTCPDTSELIYEGNYVLVQTNDINL